MPFAADKRHAWPKPLHNYIACTSLQPGEKAAETIWHTLNVVSTYQNTLNFLDSLVIFRRYFKYWEWKGEFYTSYHIHLIF